jgi:hypothetical protein
MGELIPWDMVTDKSAGDARKKYLEEGDGLYSR